jgi:hypothetical protein
MPDSSLSRREFLRLLTAMGGASALASVLESCSRAGIAQQNALPPTHTHQSPAPVQEWTSTATPVPPKPAPTQTAFAPSDTPTRIVDDKARVAFVKTNHRAEGVRQAIDLLGINPVAGKRVFLKPNFNSADPPPGSTHPDVLIALVTKLKEMGAQTIAVGDRSGMGNTRQVMEKIGVFKWAQEMVGWDDLIIQIFAKEGLAPGFAEMLGFHRPSNCGNMLIKSHFCEISIFRVISQ